MTDSIVKAIVAKVNIGTIEFEGLMFPDGNFGVSVQQLRLLAFPSASPNNALRELKSACGKGSQLTIIKCATQLNNNPQWVIKLEQVNFCLTELAFKGHEEARDLIRLLASLSLYQLFNDAFDIQCDKDERQAYLRQRQFHAKQYHPLVTKWLQIDGVMGKEYGKQVNLFKLNADCPLKSVNEYNSDELHQLNNAEVRYDVLRKTGMSHSAAINHLL